MVAMGAVLVGLGIFTLLRVGGDVALLGAPAALIGACLIGRGCRHTATGRRTAGGSAALLALGGVVLHMTVPSMAAPFVGLACITVAAVIAASAVVLQGRPAA